MQIIFDIIIEEFENFVKKNIKIFESMYYNEIVNITNKGKIFEHALCAINMLREPFNVTYIGKKAAEKGDFYVFFNYNMDKIYTYCTVE